MYKHDGSKSGEVEKDIRSKTEHYKIIGRTITWDDQSQDSGIIAASSQEIIRRQIEPTPENLSKIGVHGVKIFASVASFQSTASAFLAVFGLDMARQGAKPLCCGGSKLPHNCYRCR
jgi:hypothetical protein